MEPVQLKARHMQGVKLVIGRAPWWIAKSGSGLYGGSNNNNKNNNNNMKKRGKQTFPQALKDFLQNVSLHCYGKLVEPGRRFQERFFWFIFHVVALAILIIFLWNTYNQNDGRLLATTIYDPLYPVTKIPFPTISICSVNRISNASAMSYAEELNVRDPLHRGAAFFYDRIQMLSYIYYSQSSISDFEQAMDFQRFLDLHDTEDSELFYNTRRRMKMLTPRCKDLLLECHLGGIGINCSAEFEETLTSRGLCCTFNTNGKHHVERDFKMRFFGGDQGLVLLLNASTKDDFYKISNLDGFIGMIYGHNDYPEPFSGGVDEHFVEPGLDTYFFLSSVVLETVREATVLSPRARNCLFENEMPRAFGNSYSFNQCISRCRARSILILCNCLLFQMPYNYLDVATKTVFCTLQHSQCLKRYTFKWLNVITRREHSHGLEHEMEDALYCPYCLPSCSETLYTVSPMGLQLTPYSLRSFNQTFSHDNFSDLSVLRIGFGETHVHYYKQILKDSWFEIFSTIGNICGMITGFSLIAFCEILFFLISQIWAACHDEISKERKRNGQRRRRRLLCADDSNPEETLFILP